MAKKKKKEQLPEGMSRRQAKLAARAAERAAFERDPRPYGGFSFETDLVAVQEFVPSAIAKIEVEGLDNVYLCTVLPGGSAALVREESAGGEVFVALQTQARSQNPNRDLAYALNWAKTAKPGDILERVLQMAPSQSLRNCSRTKPLRSPSTPTLIGGSQRTRP